MMKARCDSYNVAKVSDYMDSIVMVNEQPIKIHYHLEGHGPAMILLHGWGQDMRMMQFISDYYKANYQVLNLDLPGFGESDEPPCPWQLQDYVTCLYQCVKLLGLEHPILVAHSFGARIALLYAKQYMVKKMVLTGAAGIRDHHSPLYYVKVGLYKIKKRLGIANHMGSVDYRAASSIMRGVLVASVKQDLKPILKDINVPTLLVWGEKDTATPLWMGKQMEKRMPDATLVVLEEDDHFAYFHQPKRFLAIMEYFL